MADYVSGTDFLHSFEEGLANRVALDPIQQQNNDAIKPTEQCATQYFGRYLGKNPIFLSSIFFACAHGARASARVP